MRTMSLVLCVLLTAAAASGQDRSVTYRVTYGSGIVADVLSPPPTNADIKSVQRIVITSGSVNLSTGDSVDDTQGKLAITNLAWDGKTWSVPQPNSAPSKDRTVTEEDLISAEIRKAEQLLLRMQEAIKAIDHQAAETQRKIDAVPPADEAAVKASRDKLADIQRQRDSLLKTIESYRDRQATLEKLKKDDTFTRPQGRVQAAPMPASAPAIEASPEAGTPANPVQVKRLPSGEGKRTYRISLPHAEVGAAGAFYFVAYADTNGDGVPDKLIARSPLAQAVIAGGWSTWTFTTSEKNVFAGNAIVGDDINLAGAAETAGDSDGRGALKQEYFVSGFFGKAPREKRSFVPYLENIRVEIPQCDASEDAESQIIVK